MADDPAAASGASLPASQHHRSTRSGGDVVKLAVFCPQRPLQPGVDAADVAELYTLPEKLEVPSSSTVRDLKVKLENDFPGGPLAAGQTLLWHGRRLADDEVLQQVVQGTQQVGTCHLYGLLNRFTNSHIHTYSQKWAMYCI